MGIRRWLGRNRADDERARELRAHLQIEIDEHLARGLPVAEARRRASLRLGNTTRLREDLYSMRMDGLVQDIRYAFRQLRSTPGFAAVVLLTLALGIGATTAVFSVTHAALLRSLPVKAADRLVYLNTTNSIQAQSGNGNTSLTDAIFEQLRMRHDVFSDLVGFAPVGVGKVGVRYGAEPDVAQVELVSGDFFSGLGVAPALGRVFTRDEEASHAPVAVVSYDYWSARLGRDPGAVGHRLTIKGEPFTIVGVTAPGFAGVEYEQVSEVYIPLQTNPNLQPWDASPTAGISLYGTTPRWWCLKMIGRLAPGMTSDDAVARLNPVFTRTALEGTTRHYSPQQTPELYLTPARGVDGVRDDYGQPLAVLMVMVVLVLAIGCSNIAMLLIARNAARQREFSLRLAIGAGRVRLFRQLLTESLILVAIGGALGWVFASWATGALATWTHLDLDLAPDRTVLFFAMALSAIVALVFGLAPLRGVARVPVAGVLRVTGPSGARDARRVAGSRAVTVGQAALCLALLSIAGFLVQTQQNLRRTDLGIRTPGLLVFGVSPQNLRSDAEAHRFYASLLEGLRSVSGVESATLMRERIGSGWTSNSSVTVDGADPVGDGNAHVRWNAVGPDYFHVLGSPMLMGRDFSAADSATAPPVVIVNRTFADRYLAGRSPLGHQAAVGTSPPAEIVGVVQDVKYADVREKAMPMAWLPYEQTSAFSTAHIELRTTADAATVLPAVRRTVQGLAPELPLLEPMTQQEQFERSYSYSTVVARLAVFFGALAALLVAMGLYGTLSYAVNRRTAEMGVRLALGARRGQVIWMVVRGSLVLSAVGIAIGLPLAIAGARAIRAMLFGVAPEDPSIYGGALLLLVAIAIVASALPARRAASIEPLTALRQG